MWRLWRVLVLPHLLLVSGCFEKGVDYHGPAPPGVDSYVSTGSAEQCQERCQQTDECNYFTWDPNWNTACWMKKSQGTLNRDKPHLVSGPRECPAATTTTTRRPGEKSSKKGLSVALYPEGYFRCEDLKEFTGISWYYNWGVFDPKKDPKCAGLDIPSGFVPMIWGQLPLWLPNLDDYDTVLGFNVWFNEPNHAGQSNMRPDHAARAWKQLEAVYPNHTLVGPAAAPGGQWAGGRAEEWFDAFFRECDKLGGCRMEYIATHLYTGAPDYDKRFLTNLYNKYGKKIWFTEFVKPSTRDWREERSYMEEMLPWLENSEAIWRYSWFVHRWPKAAGSWKEGWYLDKAISLMKDNSSALTELGRFYNNF